MATMEIAIEIGTSNTSIFLPGNGIVLREPTLIAFLGDPKQKKIRAVGRAAAEMLGKTPERTTVISPVTDGVITDPESCTLLIREFIKKILPKNFIFFPKIKAILGIPTGLSVDERKMYENVLVNAYVRDVIMVENIILSAIGIDLPIATSNGGLICNIGGGITEVAVMASSGVISGCGISLGGTLMDKAILDSIAGKYNLNLGLKTVRKLKKEIGTLYENDNSKMTVDGIDVTTRNISSAKIKASDLCSVLTPYYIRIRDAIESIINMCPPDIASDIKKTGIYVVGGGSKITGLEDFLIKELNLPVCIPENPDFVAITGAGRLLSDKALLYDILAQK